MADRRPYVLLSVAMSLDGHIDDAGPARLVLSGPEDLDRVDEVRAGVDGILVGAGTIRADDPRLVVRSEPRRRQRIERGRPGSPVKITMTVGGDLDPASRFFTEGSAEKIVYTHSAAGPGLRERLAGRATVVDAGAPLRLDAVLADLRDRGIERLLVEGGTAVHTLFLTAGVVDELHVVVAPVFVGDARAPRFVGPGAFPPGRLLLSDVEQVGDVVLLRYRPRTGHR